MDTAKELLNKKQIIFGLLVGLYAVYCYYHFLGFNVWLIPLTYFFMPVWLFTGGIHAINVVKVQKPNVFLLWMYAPLVVLVIVIDVVWNMTMGTLIFREIPREMLFTDRCKRHIENSTHTRDYRYALYWSNVLNAIDPGHVEIP